MTSSMKAVIGLLIFMISTVLTDMAGECDMAAFYMELGCTPVASTTKDSCPESFNCPELHPDPTKCYYKGVAYAHLAPVPQNLISNPCSQGCFCSVSNGVAEFQCAAVDCFETFDGDLNQECIFTSEIDSCCNTGTVCGKDALAKLKTCEYDGEVYREGQEFEPRNTKKTCICTAEWNGTIDNPLYCRDIDCGLELHYQNNLQLHCAPVFTSNVRTCPIGFECPTATNKVIRGLNMKNLSSQCTFGNLTLSIGDEVTVDDTCSKCTCNVPPFVNCVKKNSCDS